MGDGEQLKKKPRQMNNGVRLGVLGKPNDGRLHLPTTVRRRNPSRRRGISLSLVPPVLLLQYDTND